MTNKELRAHLLIEAANILEEIDESAGRNSALSKYCDIKNANDIKRNMHRAMDEHDLDKAIKYKKDYDSAMEKVKNPKYNRIPLYNTKVALPLDRMSLNWNKLRAASNRDWVNNRNYKNSIKSNPIHAKINNKSKNESRILWADE